MRASLFLPLALGLVLASCAARRPPILTIHVSPHVIVSAVLAPPIHLEAHIAADTLAKVPGMFICFEADGPDYYSSACAPVNGPLMTASLSLPADGKYEIKVTLYNLTGDDIASQSQEVDVGVVSADASPPEPEFNLTR